MKTSLVGTGARNTTITACLRVLAAEDHRRQTRWWEYIIPLLESGNTAGIDALLAGNPPTELMSRIVRDERSANVLTGWVICNSTWALPEEVLQIMRRYVWASPDEVLLRRKTKQLTAWVQNIPSYPSSTYEDWELRYSTAFVDLAPEKQCFNYVAAARDLRIIAATAGLVLPEQLPEVEPLKDWRAGWLRQKHRFGMHGPYMVSEDQWHTTCQACGRPGPASTP